MQHDSLIYLSPMNTGLSVVIEGTAGAVGLAGSMRQFTIAFVQLRGLDLRPLFQVA
jgi:hypothetical protein